MHLCKHKGCNRTFRGISALVKHETTACFAQKVCLSVLFMVLGIVTDGSENSSEKVRIWNSDFVGRVVSQA